MEVNEYINELFVEGVLTRDQAKKIKMLAEDKIGLYRIGYEHGVMDQYEGNIDPTNIINKY